MNWLRHPRPGSAQLAAYLEDEVSAAEAAVLEAQLAGSKEARTHLTQLAELQVRLRAVDPALETIDLTLIIRRSIMDARSEIQRPKTWVWARWASAIALTACGVSMLLMREPVPGLRVKSATTAGSERSHAAVIVYRVTKDGEPEPVGSTVSRGDGLMFSFVNPGPRPFTHLMIFGVDSTQQIRWFHPAYTVAGTNPTSIALEPRQAPRLLADIIEHDFSLGPMTVYALFSRVPLHVADIEARLAAGPLDVQTQLDAGRAVTLEAFHFAVVP
jgi:hypothetical protein